MFSDYGYAEEGSLGKPYDMGILKRLFPYIKPFWKYLSGAVALIIIITFLDLSLPYITKTAIDKYIVPVHAKNADKGGRYLIVDGSDHEIAKIIKKYPAFFEKRGNIVKLPLSDLKEIGKTDIMALRKKDIKGVGIASFIYVMASFLIFILTFCQLIIMEYAGQRIMHNLRMTLFGHIQSLSISYFNKNPIARLVTRTTNDIQNMHELFTSILVVVFKDFFLLSGITAVMIVIHFKLALVCFSILPVVIGVSLYFSRLAREVFRDMRIKVAEINTRFSETIGGMKIIQLFGKQKENYEKFSKLNHAFYLDGMKQIHIFAFFMPLIELLSSVALALVIYYGGKGVISSDITLGVLVAFISYMRMFFRPIRELSEKYNILQNAMSSAERIFGILDIKERENTPVLRDPSGKTRKIDLKGHKLKNLERLSFKNVCFNYNKNEKILENISFELEKGRTIAIVGRTGSGKTSLINLIIRFYKPTKGKILINGKDAEKWDLWSVRSKIALVTQDPFLFSESIKDNIILGTGKKDIDLDRILDAAKCKFFVKGLPKGIETLLSEGGSSISSGQRQLISIARAFARDPDLIIFDEATSYIDTETEVKIQQALSLLMENRTTIIVAHRLSTARNADRIIVLNKGRIIESGAHEELMNKKGFYFRLNMIQRMKFSADISKPDKL